MAIIKKYNAVSEEWEAILVGEQGPAGTAAPVDTTAILDGTYTILAADIGKLREFTDAGGCTITIPDDLGNDLDDFEIYLYRKGGALDISHSINVTTEGIDPANVAEGGTFAVKKFGANNQYLII